MAVSAFQKLVNKLFREFALRHGREPMTPKEWMDLQNEAVRHFNKTKGAPTEAKPSWHTGWTPKVVPGGKGIKSLLETGDVTIGTAPKTKLSTLEGKKQKLDAALSKEEWIAKKQRENKEAIERFKAKTKKKTVEDFRDEGDWDPGGFAGGGIARPGYFLGNLVKLLRGGKTVYRGTSTKGGIGGHFVPESKKFLKGKYYTTDKKLAEMYAELGKGILGIKKLTLSKKELEKAKRIGQKFHEEIILPKKLAKEAEIDIPGSIKVNMKKIIKDIREGNAEGGRIAMAGGGAIKKFIEGLFIKASNDIRLGKGKWKGLTQPQWIKQHDDLTKMMKKWEWNNYKRLPPGAEEYIGMNDLQIARAVKQAEKQVGDEKLMQKAYDEIKGGSGFTDDYKYDADILAEEYARQHGKVFADLPEDQISIYYDPALKRVQQDLLKRREARKAFEQQVKDVDQKIELEMFDTKGRKPNAEGGRQDFIFGGSAGLRALIKRIKGRNKRIMPSKIGIDKRDLAKKIMPREFEQLENLKIEQLENLLEGLKLDKQQMGMRTSHKALNDPILDSLMKNLDEIPGSGLTPEADLAKYVDIDKDILALEQMIKNKRMKGRKPNASGGLAYMLGEPNTRTEALQEFGVVTDPWGMYTDPSLYAQGERSTGAPGRGEYAEGGGVGLPPFTMSTPRPPQPEQLDTPQPHGIGQPNPMHVPKGIPSAAPRSMDPQYQQQQMMQRMMGQQMGQQPRMGFAGGGMSRRAFLKLMASLGALPFIGKGVQKAAPKVIPKVTEEVIKRGPDGIPSYAYSLIEVVKAKGTKEIMEGLTKRNPPATKYEYKGVEVIEDGLGNTSVKKSQTKTGTWTDEATDDTLVDDYVDREIGFEIKEGGYEQIGNPQFDDAAKSVKMDDEYVESTAYMQGDLDGGIDVSDIVEKIDDADHLDLKKIADEVDTLHTQDHHKTIRRKKASGGLAHMLGE